MKREIKEEGGARNTEVQHKHLKSITLVNSSSKLTLYITFILVRRVAFKGVQPKTLPLGLARQCCLHMTRNDAVMEEPSTWIASRDRLSTRQQHVCCR